MSTDTANPIASVREEDAAAVVELVQRITVGWNANDADYMSTVYSEDASVALPGATLKGRPAIREWMAESYAGKWKGTHVLGAPEELRYIADDIMLMVSKGGAYLPGSTEVPIEHAIRGLWLFVKRDGTWLIHGYANTPVGSTIPLPDTHR
jgi:uncharacterized protein (TIGR02246 family)